MVTQMNTTWHYLGTRWTVFYTTWGNFKTTLKQLWDTKTPWGLLCNTLETILRPLWGQHWDNCGTTLTQLCYNFERNFGRPLWGQYWDNCGTTLTQLCYNFERNFGRREKTLGQLLDNIETISGHLRDNLGTTLGQLWKKNFGTLWDNLGITLQTTLEPHNDYLVTIGEACPCPVAVGSIWHFIINKKILRLWFFCREVIWSWHIDWAAHHMFNEQ